MKPSLYKYRRLLFILALVFCVAAGIYSVDRAKPNFIENTLGFVVIPIQNFNTKVSSWISDKIKLISHINEIENENELLKFNLAAKEEEIKRLEQTKMENERLTQLLGIDSKYRDYPKITADIIAKDPGNWYNIFTINKGSRDGLAQNMTVLSSGGLVGRIKECGYNYSKVISIIDDTNAVSAKSLRTDDIGFIKGDLSNKGMCKMDYIDNEAEIIEGDEIVTSHLSEIYPPGITIGYVAGVESDRTGLSKCAVVETTVDFRRLETVLVITENFSKNYDEDIEAVSGDSLEE